MKILILADLASSHTIKWIRALANQGCEIYGYSLSPFEDSAYEAYGSRVSTTSLNLSGNLPQKNSGSWQKIAYLKAIPQVRRLIKSFKPHIVHAHYASSYGFLGAMAGFKPFVLSAWGSDVYDFPKKSPIHRACLVYNLSRAQKVLSTSNIMAEEVRRYTKKPTFVTPFGVDLKIFKPKKVRRWFGEDIVIGTVKSLEEKYGISHLITAFAKLKKLKLDRQLKLLIVGGGSQRFALEGQAKKLGVHQDCLFTGRIPFDQISTYHNQLDIAVYPSIFESFGVSVVESGACGKPVVVYDVGGLSEVVEHEKTGFRLPLNDLDGLTSSIAKLVMNPSLREAMGKNARARVQEFYNWDQNVNLMIDVYKDAAQIRSAN